jgi:hypothetical protein
MVQLIIPTLILSVLALVASLTAIVLVLAMKYSTHKIEWKTLDFEKFEEDEKKEEDSDEVLEKALALQRKKKKIEDPLDSLSETSNF